MKPQFIKTILISLLFFQTTIFPIFGLSRSISPSPGDLTPDTPVIFVPDTNVKTPSRLRRIARKITTTVGRITLVTVLAGGTTASFEATPGHNVALSLGKFVPVSALTTNHCLHTFNGQCARVVSLTTRDGTFPVYDLEVEEDHTFGITPLGIVVHNSNKPKIADLACALTKKWFDNFLSWLNKGPKDTYVYLGKDKFDEVVYAGITKDVLKRQGQHGTKFDIKKISEIKLTRNQALCVEQNLIDKLKKLKEKNPDFEFENKINSIRKGRDIEPEAVKWGEEWLKTNGLKFP